MSGRARLRRSTYYDTTLRDGTQGENITLSLADKLRIARMLDEYGMPYVEGGWPGSNPKDVEFFAAARTMRWEHRPAGRLRIDPASRQSARDENTNLNELAAAETPVATISARAGCCTSRRCWVPPRAETWPWSPSRWPSWPNAAPRWSTTPSTSSTATARIRPMRWPPCVPPARPAPAAWCCATPTAAA